ncbi:MAG: glycosyltransferase [Leuconostoc mesenteroides]
MINTIEFNRNGMSTMIMNYYKHFNHNEVKVDFLVNKLIDSEFEKTIKQNGDNIFLYKNRNRYPLSYIKFLKSLAMNNGYDIVYVHGNSATMAVEEFALRAVDTNIIIHAHGQTTNHPLLNFLLHPYFNKHYTAAFAASKHAGEFLFRKKPFTIINNGIEGEKFKFDASKRKLLRRRYNIENSRVMLQVGGFTKQKNHDFTIKVVERLIQKDKSIKLLLAGQGPLEQEIKNKVSSLNLNEYVIFLGEASNLEELYSAADILLFPSSWEPFGIVALEGQMAGLPVFVSDRFTEAVKVTKNIVYLPLDVGMWVNTISNTKSYRKLSDENLVLSLKNLGYDIEDNEKQMMSLFYQIIRKKNEK